MMGMLDLPLGYHITFGTYGTRLHGDPRGTIMRELNRPGDRIIGRVEEWQHFERERLNYDPVTFDLAKRTFIELMVPQICKRGGWTFINVAAQRDHVHVLLSAFADGKAVRKWLKRWLGETLSVEFGDPSARRAGGNPNAKPTWWAEGGSVRWVWDETYLATVYEYIDQQRSTKRT